MSVHIILHNTNYAFFELIKKGHKAVCDAARMPPTVGIVHHLNLSDETLAALDIIKWCLCVPKLRPDSPRFAYYVSRWLVPQKIDAAKKRGVFDELTRDAGPIDPGWLRLVKPALEEYKLFAAQHSLQCSHDVPHCEKLSTVAA